MPPRLLQVHPADNVAVVVNPEGLPAGSAFPSGLTLREAVPAAHKVALAGIPASEPIRRYGHTIGFALRDIPAGAWVHEGLLALPAPPDLDNLPDSAPPPPLPPLDGLTFDGYRNPDGSAGTLNLLGISTTVQCVAPTVDHAVRRIREEILPRFPHVDGVVALTHPYGCGVAIQAPSAVIPIRTLQNLALNPNLGGAPVAVSLGCEKLQPTQLFPQLDPSPFTIRLQDPAHLGFEAMVNSILTLAERRLEELNRRRRTACPVSDLVVGLQCGGSDAFSGITANPAAGRAADLLVRAGATVLFSEVTEIRDAVHLLAPRAASPAVLSGLAREMAWYDQYLAAGSVDRSANPTPGNKLGGLSTIVEKALGSLAKSGSSPLAAVAGPGERVTTKGLVFAATPASDFICGTLQLAAGMNLHVFTTGQGTPYGLEMAPVLKVSSRTALARQWPDLIDFDAGRIATGTLSLDAAGHDLFHLLLDAASGRYTPCANRLRLFNPLALFNPAPVT